MNKPTGPDSLSEADIQEFTEIWKREFGETLTPDQASFEARQLMELYGLLYQRLPREAIERVIKVHVTSEDGERGKAA